MCSKRYESAKNISKDSGEKQGFTEIRAAGTKKRVATCAKLQNSMEL